MNRKTIKRLERDTEKLTGHEPMVTGWLRRYREAQKDLAFERANGNRAVIEVRTFGGWLMSGDWERPETKFRVRYAR
jgi:hypothetical protein